MLEEKASVNGISKTNKPQYYTRSAIAGEVVEVYATEDEAFAGGQDWDLDPVVYYRVKWPIKNLEMLPAFDYDALFEKHESEDS